MEGFFLEAFRITFPQTNSKLKEPLLAPSSHRTTFGTDVRLIKYGPQHLANAKGEQVFK